MSQQSVMVPAGNPTFLRNATLGKVAAVGLKVAVTGACFWYIWRQTDLLKVSHYAAAMHVGWVALGVAAIMMQLPLIGLRWCRIIDALSDDGRRIPRGQALAITAIGAFFVQVLPYAVGEAVRVIMLARLGRDWRQGMLSVLIDRGIGVVGLVAFGFVILLFPSDLTALGGYRRVTLDGFGLVLFVFMLGLVAAPLIAPFLGRWSGLRWIGRIALATNTVLIRSRAGGVVLLLTTTVHVLTILTVWCTGMTLGLSISPFDAAVLFTLMVAVAVIPVSFGGWGVREVAVVALLTSHGLSVEQALFFSVCFGLILVLGVLPGALVWAVYSPTRTST